MFKNEHHPDSDTIIGPSVHVEGDVVSQGNIQVYGAVSGTITTAANLMIGDGATITANVKAVNASISGTVKGNVTVSERLELTPSSKVIGDIAAKVLVIAEGAQLDGRCQMTTPASQTASQTKPTTKRAAAEAA